MATGKEASKPSICAGRECCLTPYFGLQSVQRAHVCPKVHRSHRLAEFVLSFATKDSGCRDSVVALSVDASKPYYVPEAAVTGVKTEDKTMAKGKTVKHRESNPGPEREGRKKRGGKVSGAGLAFFPLISCNSPNHNDRKRAIDGESEQGKGEIWANGKKEGGGGCMKGKRN